MEVRVEVDLGGNGDVIFDNGGGGGFGSALYAGLLNLIMNYNNMKIYNRVGAAKREK